MKVRFIEPKPPGVNVYDQARLPRLGLPLIGRLLRDQGHDVRCYVEVLAPVDWDDVCRADLVGLSSTTSTTPAAYAMADRLRQAGIPTVIGGPHVTFLPDEALEHCDFVVRGEGQETMLELAEALVHGGSLTDIAGLSWCDSDGGRHHNPPRPPCSQEAFAALPAPDLTLIHGYERMSTWPIMTQWGCPFNCDFCGVIQMFGRRVRQRSIESVLAELEAHQPPSVFFYDDNFVVDKERTKALLRAMIARGLTPRWSAQVRAEVVYRSKRTREVDHELLALMRDSGCTTVYCGFESVNPETLQAYNKQQDVRTITDSIRLFHEHGIRVHGMFVLGADADDVATIRQTVEFALQQKIDTVQFLILTPCPGTPLFDRVAAEGRILSYNWALYDGHHVLIHPARMSPYELQIETYRAMMRFYSHWQVIRVLSTNLIHHARTLIGVMLRERRFSLQLPRLAVLSLVPRRRREILDIVRTTLSERGQRILEQVFANAFLRKYGHDQLVRWAKQAHSKAYVEWTRRLSQLPRLPVRQPNHAYQTR